MLPAGSLDSEELRIRVPGRQHCGYIILQAVPQPSAPEGELNYRQKHVELIGIVDKSSLLHLVGGLYYLYYRVCLYPFFLRVFNLLAPEVFFLILAHSVYKM